MNQQFFSVLWDGYESDKAARRARDTEARRLRTAGHRVLCGVLRNQTRKYAGFGQGIAQVRRFCLSGQHLRAQTAPQITRAVPTPCPAPARRF